MAVLARIGDPDPLAAVEAFRQAASLPELRHSAAVWVPRALASAHPGRSALRLAEVVVEGRANGREGLEAEQLAALAALLGSGDGFADRLRERPEWAAGLSMGPRSGLKPPRPVWSEIRDAHGEGVLRIGVRSLLGAPVLETLQALSDLADGCVGAAVECAAGETGVAPPAVLAWGRFGSREPGLVCALELLLVDAAASPGSQAERASECETFAERLLEELPQPFEPGLTYAIGPALSGALAPAGACVQPLSSAIAFWRARRALHQHAPLVSLRHVAGPAGLAAEFERAIGLLLDRDAASEDELHARAAARGSRRRSGSLYLGDPLACEADLLEGPCGILTLERIVRGLQLRSGSRARVSFSAALDHVAAQFPLAEAGPQPLALAHVWLRRAELALGLLGAPSPVLPADTEGQVAMARSMGYAEPDAARALRRFLHDWRAVRDELHETVDRVRRELKN